MLNQDEIQKIIDATDIVKLVSNYIKLEKNGKNYKGLCPFHSEDTPSFVVSPEKNLAHCFGCGGGGSPVKFLEQIENISFMEALEKLANFNGIPFEAKTNTKIDNNTKYYKIMQIAVNFYKKVFESTEEGLNAKEYLHQRGLDDDTINDFNIGLSPKPGDTLYQVLKESKILELDMSDVGLVDKGKNNYYDLFSNRIMFPIYNEDGNPIGFSARIFNNNDKNTAKYINSRETLIYKKANVIFNLQNAKGNILKNKRVILHEGQMDVIASYRSGLKEAICTMGTALSINQAKLLQKYTNHAIICYDGDKAGINASLKAINVFKSLGFIIHLVLLPNGMDPDEYVLKYGTLAYKEYFLSNLLDTNQYRFKVYTENKNLNDSNIVNQVKNNCFSLIAEIKSHTEEEDYLNRLSKLLNASIDAIKNDYYSYKTNIYLDTNQYYDNNTYEPTYPTYPEIKPVTDCSDYEARLFQYARSSRTVAMRIENEISEFIEGLSTIGQYIWIKLIDYYNLNEIYIDEDFIKMLSEEQVNYYVLILEKIKKTIAPFDDKDLEDCVEKIRTNKFDTINHELVGKIISTDDVTKQSRYIDDIFKNKRNQAELIKKRRK